MGYIVWSILSTLGYLLCDIPMRGYELPACVFVNLFIAELSLFFVSEFFYLPFKTTLNLIAPHCHHYQFLLSSLSRRKYHQTNLHTMSEFFEKIQEKFHHGEDSEGGSHDHHTLHVAGAALAGVAVGAAGLYAGEQIRKLNNPSKNR